MSIYKNLSKCRLCNSKNFSEVIRIDDQYLSPTFVKTNEGNSLANIKVPHTLVFCNDCNLLQLRETVNPDLLYKQYFYRSAVSDTMRNDLKKVVEDVSSRVKLDPGDCVVDIGANDCTMISYFSDDLNRCGIEPAENIEWSHVKNINIVNDYFTEDSLNRAVGDRKVKVFTSCAMFYDLDDPNSFVNTIKKYLHPDGIFCIQLSYLVAMFRNVNFYDICNEHLEYYSIDTLEKLMNRHSLEIFDAEENNVNGGSVRVMITHSSKRAKSERLMKLIEIEKSMNLDNPETYVAFNKKIDEIKEKVTSAIDSTISSGGLVLGLGASTKGNMLLQTFGIGKELLPCISERNPDKVGLRTLGTDIELISESTAREMKPSCMLVLPWYFKNEIVKREKEYISLGGKLLFPMPYPHLVTKNGEVIL